MKSEEENLRKILLNYTREKTADAPGKHLRDADFLRLFESTSPEKTDLFVKANGKPINSNDSLALLRAHLAACNACLAEFKDFYAFYAPAGENEAVAGKAEINAAWQAFAPQIETQKASVVEEKSDFWARMFPAERKIYFGTMGWGFAALLLLASIVSIFVAYDAKNQNSQLAAQIENQKRISEERLKTLEQSAQNSNLAEQEKSSLTAEKDELQKQIAKLQTELERARQPIAARDLTPPKNPGAISPPAADNSLIAANTPIYDVFPADSAVRSGGENVRNRLNIPKEAKSIVLILNAAGSAEFQKYRAEISGNSGAILWRGSGLKKDNLGNFTFTIARAALKPGNYRLKLYGQNSDQPLQIVTEYSLTISVK
jgi:hypothetical protein